MEKTILEYQTEIMKNQNTMLKALNRIMEILQEREQKESGINRNPSWGIPDETRDATDYA